MSKLTGSSLILLAIILIIVGAIIQSNAIQWLVTLILNIIGIGFIAVGIVVGIYGVMRLLRGSRSSSYSDY